MRFVHLRLRPPIYLKELFWTELSQRIKIDTFWLNRILIIGCYVWYWKVSRWREKMQSAVRSIVSVNEFGNDDCLPPVWKTICFQQIRTRVLPSKRLCRSFTLQIMPNWKKGPNLSSLLHLWTWNSKRRASILCLLFQCCSPRVRARAR